MLNAQVRSVTFRGVNVDESMRKLLFSKGAFVGVTFVVTACAVTNETRNW